MRFIKNTLKTALAALILSCPPSALARGAGDDFQRMSDLLQQNLQAMRQMKTNINNSGIPDASKKRLLEEAGWEIRQAERRAAAFNSARDSAKTSLNAVPAIVRDLDARISDIERQNTHANNIELNLEKLYFILCDGHNKAGLPADSFPDCGRLRRE